MWYLDIKEHLIDLGFDDEIEWQYSACTRDVTCQVFLKEAAWVVLCSGFRESLIRAVFPAVASAFGWWRDAEWIIANREQCIRQALSAFGNVRKINAIADAATIIESHGLEQVSARLMGEGPGVLQMFPMIGPITAFHLAKNIGFPVAKPDRHVVRLALMLGHESANSLCSSISDMVGDPIQVVDLVLWRYVANSGIDGINLPPQNCVSGQAA